MSIDEIREKLILIIERGSGKAGIRPDMDLILDLGLDSIGYFILLENVEREFSVKFSNQDIFTDVTTVEELSCKIRDLMND
ncbi:acyl carrier protein [Butyrivibrio sp. MC2013]|uniref:acyl carrier protein n=1 Tax=Butyrivibrio sp. MC2013 TaxID=1280686 RepID=UPI000415C685|nr:phosphopantetheine-binding protein [Butyrivibrio sp. MC2013]